MSAVDTLLASPWGAWLAILAMAAATYLCRASGVVLMSRVTITPRIERALRALPGSIVMATILPLAIDGGLPAVAALATAVLAMRLVRFELFALVAGLAVITALRGAGL